MVDVDNFVFMSLCLMVGGIVATFFDIKTKRHKDRLLGMIFLFLCLYV